MVVGEEEFGAAGLPDPDYLVKIAINHYAKKPRYFYRGFLMVVGEEGFEPPTLWSQTRCATKLRYSPKIL